MDTSINAETVYRDCYWTDDSRNAFREAVHAEALRQVMASAVVIQRDPHPVHGGGISREECEARARVIAEALNAAGLV